MGLEKIKIIIIDTSHFSCTIIAVICRILVNPFSNVLQKQITIKGQHPLFINLTTYLLLAIISLF